MNRLIRRAIYSLFSVIFPANCAYLAPQIHDTIVFKESIVNNNHIVLAADKKNSNNILGESIYTVKKKHAHIEYLSIDSQSRNKGLGTELLLATMRKIKAHGITTIKLYARRSIPFYKRVGFELDSIPTKKSAQMIFHYGKKSPRTYLNEHYQTKNAQKLRNYIQNVLLKRSE